MLDIAKDFPLLVNYNHEGRMVYVDNAATTQKPQCVLDALTEWFTTRNANPHRGSYKLGALSTDIYEYARSVVADHINADRDEVVFCRNTTEAINLVALGFIDNLLHEGDEIVVSISEHHSNITPWQNLARRRNCRLRYLLTDELGHIPESEIDAKISTRTKVLAIAQVSNVLGTRFPVEMLAARAHEKGAFVVIDCAQGFLHCGVDVSGITADFIAFSGHKAFGPDGIGILWGKRELLEEMQPVYWGGEMVEKVSWSRPSAAAPPLRFEAGTQNASGAFAFAVAIHYIEQFGHDAIRNHEAMLTERLLEGIEGVKNLKLYGNPHFESDRCGIVSFNFIGQSSLMVARHLDSRGITVRAGTHCAQPLLKYLGVGDTCRISFAPYNTLDEVDWIIEVLRDLPASISYTVMKKMK